MPAYLTEPSLITEVRTLAARISKLEQSLGGSTFDTGSTGGGGGGISGDYVLRAGDTMTGSLTLLSSLSATSATFSGNVTIDGTLTTASGGFANDIDVVHLAGAETISGSKAFTAQQTFATGTYFDPDPGVTRAIKIGYGGIAVAGGVKTDDLIASNGITVTGGTIITTGLTASSAIVANGGLDIGNIVDLSRVTGTLASTNTGVGDKIGLYSNTYGVGVQTNRLVLFAPSTAGVSFRSASGTGNASSGSDVHTFLSNGNATHTGSLTIGTGLTLSAGSVTAPVGSINGSTLVKDTVTGVGSSSGTGVGHLAPLTVGTDNIANGAVTSPKLSLGAVASANVAIGTLRDTTTTMFRTATANTVDAAGQPVGGLTPGTGMTRSTDSTAFDGVAIMSGTATNGAVTTGPGYAGLQPGQYKVTFYLWSASTSSSDIVTLGVSGTGVTTYSEGVSGVELNSASKYVGYSIPLTITAATNSLNTTVTHNSGSWRWSHVTVEPRAGLVTNDVQTQYIRDLAITSAKVNDLSAAKLTAGIINVDDIFIGTGGHVYAGITTHPGATTARVELASGGLFAYDGTAQTFNLSSTGSLTLKGSITAGSTITGTTLTGTSGIAAGSGNAIFIAGSNGIQLGHATFGSAPFRVDMAGNLVATSATIQGSMTAGTISGVSITATNSIDGAAIIAGTIDASAVSISSRTFGPANTNYDVETAGATQQTPPGWHVWETTGTVSAYGRVADPTPRNQGYVYKINPAVSGGGSVATDAIPVTPGDSWEVSTQVYATVSTGPVYFRVNFGADPTFTSTQLISTVPTDAIVTNGNGPVYQPGYVGIANNMSIPASWTLLRGWIKVPAGATHMRVSAHAWSNTVGWTAYFDDLKAQQRVGGTEIVNGTITTSMINTTGLSGTVIQTNTLSADSITASRLNTSSYILVGGGGTVGSPTGPYGIIDGRTLTAGIRLYNSGGTNTISLDALTGSGKFTGTVDILGASTMQSTLSVTGTITGSGVIQGPTLQTASSGSRVVIDSTGIKGYATDGTTVNFRFDTSTGLATLQNATVSGSITANALSAGATITSPTISGGIINGTTFQTNSSGPRLVISTSPSGNNFLQLFNGLGSEDISFPARIASGSSDQRLFLSSGRTTSTSQEATMVLAVTSGGGKSVEFSVSNAYVSGGGNLSVDGTITTYSSVNAPYGSISGNGVYDAGYRVYSPANPPPTGSGGIFIGNSYLYNGGDYPIYLRTSGDTNHMLRYGLVGRDGPDLRGYSHVGMQVVTYSTFADAMRVDGSGNMYVGGSGLFNQSTIKVKKNIADIDSSHNGLKVIKKLRPKIYKRTDVEDNQIHVGLIAEEVVQQTPELVMLDDDGAPIAVNYTGFTTYLIHAVQELAQQVELLKNK